MRRVTLYWKCYYPGLAGLWIRVGTYSSDYLKCSGMRRLRNTMNVQCCRFYLHAQSLVLLVKNSRCRYTQTTLQTAELLQFSARINPSSRIGIGGLPVQWLCNCRRIICKGVVDKVQRSCAGVHRNSNNGYRQ